MELTVVRFLKINKAQNIQNITGYDWKAYYSNNMKRLPCMVQNGYSYGGRGADLKTLHF